MKNTVLNKLANHEITKEEAYQRLYSSAKIKKPKVRFMKLKISIPNQLTLSILLNTLFFFPVPIFLLKIGKGFIPKEYLFAFDALDYAKGTLINIQSQDAVVYIKLF